ARRRTLRDRMRLASLFCWRPCRSRVPRMARARMSVEVIDADDALEPVLDAWRSLAVAGGNAFVTPEWYLAALQVLDGDAKPAVAVARGQSGEVQALLPLVRRRSTSGPAASFAAARFGDLFDLVSADA